MNCTPPGWAAHRFPGGAFCVPARFAGQADAGWFDAHRPDAAPVGEGGRQAAWFVDGVHGPAVLRHYRRGGLRARLGGRESYLWLGASRVRAYAEVRVLDHLRRAGLRVPEPLGAAYWRPGASPFYRNAILIARIAGAQALAGRLDRADPAAVAQAIAAMHAAGVWHADLNAYNILFDADDQVWLIDFDRARLGVVSPGQAEKNRLRLRRSLVKVAGARGAQWWDALSRCFPPC
ncbi:3-deoxy-D-manno-octulosonic acid kinase [Castellaniella defragrans]|uniref:3-deoxy-D-manno-octulosonic acid kinase n=1 Tax=Castellaniella defragrans (strain DSM 12143 / CCUG 39792 / 65Phen) TaxID=1437824 RepID=W8X4N5_CASD6|nr:3-deoxy-D-manno-octulosonic acid kinase [Castellaniella defragrans]CDM24937.1 3-deoxy-D-manno-octulosonic-acid kinase [Castellaniella defragrans 65Phen]